MTARRLSIRGLEKSFGANLVLRGVDLDLEPGEIHALIGGNGAGKSTLSKIIAGIERPDAGVITLDGAAFSPGHRRVAQAAGVVMVLQELCVLPTLSVAENLFLGQLPTRWGGRVDRRQLRELARAALSRVGLGALDPDAPAATLGVGHQQLVEIAGGLAQQCQLLILDEPTAALTGGESARLFAVLRELRLAGATILYISHRLDEIAAIADRVSVLRDGQLIATLPARDASHERLIGLMAGTTESAPSVRGVPSASAATALRIETLRSGKAVQGVSFAVRRGEIVGLGGLVGAGRTELLRAIFGAEPIDGGRIHLHDETKPFVPRTTGEAVARGFAFVPEDRKRDGIFASLGVRLNTTIARLPRRRLIPGWIDRAREARECDAILGQLAVRHTDALQPIGELSGGNQQKIVIGRWLGRDVAIWLLDEPTRGVDVPARRAIHEMLRQRAAAGAAVLVASSDYDELAVLCDRVLVLSNGRLYGEFTRESLTPAAFMTAAFAGFTSAAPN